MNPRFCMTSILSAGLFLVMTQAWAAAPQPEIGAQLPKLVLETPQSNAEKEYLGLVQTANRFGLEQIASDAILIEIFSMYCPHCQKEAPIVNRLFKGIAEDNRLNGRVKLLGIGVGNSPLEVATFRKTYNIAFPLLPDGDFTIHKQLGEVRTPFFIGLHLRGAKAGKIFWVQKGAFADVDRFLRDLPELAELR